MLQNSIHDTEAYSLAKTEGEKTFIDTIKNSPDVPKQILLASDDEDKICHFDIMMHVLNDDGKYEWQHIDVKDVKEGNFNTGNYSISIDCKKYHEEAPDDSYFMAFRLVDCGIRSNMYVLANTQEILKVCNLVKQENYWLVSLKEVMQKCKYRLIKEEVL